MISKLINSPITEDTLKRERQMNVGINSDNMMVILSIQWSDNFEPNSSSKSNRGMYG